VRVSDSTTAWEAQGSDSGTLLPLQPPRKAREFWRVPAGAAVVVGVAFSVLLMAVAFGVQAKVNALVSHPALPIPVDVVPVRLIREILLWLTIVVTGAMLLQTAISTFTMGSAMLGPCLLGGAVGEVVGITVGFLLRTWTVLPVRFTAVSTLSAFPVTVLLALTATLIPAWHSAGASPALLRKE
jgi:hypothetical protein